MVTGFVLFIVLFAVIFLLQIVGFFSPYWDIQCRKNDDPNTNLEKKTCFYQGLFYGCDDSGKCRGTNIFDSRLFGLELTIILGNIGVLVLLILTRIREYNDFMKKGAVLLFALTETLNIALTIIVWEESYTIGWSVWLCSWSAVLLIVIIVVAFVCCCAFLQADGSNDVCYQLTVLCKD